CAHGAQRLGDAPHRPAPQRGVAGEGGREPLTGEDAEHEARGGAGVPAMQAGNGTRETGHVDLDGGVLTNGRDRRAQTTQDARAGLDVLARQEPRDLAGPARQCGEHQGAVGDALVTGRPDGAAHLHASSLRRHSAPRRSQAVNPAASPASSARSSSPSGSSRERRAGSSSSRFMRKISVHRAGSEAARRVASRAPGPKVAPGGVAWARYRASSDATACGRWLVSASWRSCCAASISTGCASSTLSQKWATSRAAPFPSRVDVMYTTAPLNRSPRAAAKPCSWVPASGWPPAKRGPSPNASARATIARFTDPTSVISAPAPTWGLSLPSRSR